MEKLMKLFKNIHMDAHTRESLLLLHRLPYLCILSRVGSVAFMSLNATHTHTHTIDLVSTYHIEAEVVHDLLFNIHGIVAEGGVQARIVLPVLPLVHAQGLEGVLEPGQVAQPVQVRRNRSAGKH